MDISRVGDIDFLSDYLHGRRGEHFWKSEIPPLRQDDIRWSPIRTARPKRQGACLPSRSRSPHRSPAPRSSWSRR